jgi:hypothetical protein
MAAIECAHDGTDVLMLTAKRGRQAREFRRVVGYEMADGPAGGVHYRLFLECGHVEERRVRLLRERPRMVRCGACEESRRKK